MAGTDTTKVTRECRGCTMCCEGWLSADIKGHLMYPGKKCFYLKPVTCCSIYDSRPHNPCRVYKCLWKDDNTIPYWMKPSTSGVIMTKRSDTLITVTLTSKRTSAKVEAWLEEYKNSLQGVKMSSFNAYEFSML